MSSFAPPAPPDATAPDASAAGTSIEIVALPGGAALGLAPVSLSDAAILAWHPLAVLALAPTLSEAESARLAALVEGAGMEWHQATLPVHATPDAAWERGWVYIGHRLRGQLAAGRRVLLLGDAATLVAGRLLIELGHPALLPADQLAGLVPIRPAQANFTDRLLGCLLGGALGDAFGSVVEFDRLADIRERFGPLGLQHPVMFHGRLLAGAATQLALFTLEGLLRAVSDSGDWEPGAVIAELRNGYLDWLSTQIDTPTQPIGSLAFQPAMRQVRAPGSDTLAALIRGAQGSITAPINASRDADGVARAAAVAFLPWLADGVAACALAARSAALTHGHPDAWAAAGLHAAMLHRLLEGAGLPEAVPGALADLHAVADSWQLRINPARIEQALRLAAEPIAPDIAIDTLGGGWTGDEAVAIGVYAALTGGAFTNVLARAANHDGDSACTAVLAGQLFGTAYGVAALPNAWVRRLDVLDEILELADCARDWADAPIPRDTLA